MSNKYDSEMQEVLICMMITEPELYVRSSNILSPTYFDKKHKDVVGYIHQYAEKHNGLPTIEILNAKFKTKYSELNQLNDSHKEWFFETVEDFCKKRALEEAVTQGAELIDKGNYGDLERLVKEASLVSLQRNMGTDYFSDPKARLEKLKSMNGTLSTGWKTLDEKVYQIGYGELILFSAISGGGKSVAMQNITLNFAKMGMNVVYITLELAEELVAKRLDAMLTGIKNVDIYKDIDKVAYGVKSAKKSHGSIYIKYMDPGCSPNDLKAYIRELTIQRGVKPDALIIDYIDLMAPNQKRVDQSNLFIKDKLVAEAVRALGSPENFNMVCVSAVQINRSGYDESVPGMQSMAGGMSKAYTADLAIHVNNTQQLRSKGALEFQLTKTRNSGGVGQIIEMAYDIDTLKISDQIDDPEGEKIDPHTGEVLSGNSKPSQGQDNAADRMKNLLSKIKKN